MAHLKPKLKKISVKKLKHFKQNIAICEEETVIMKTQTKAQ
jgi:hypothetical protein